MSAPYRNAVRYHQNLNTIRYCRENRRTEKANATPRYDNIMGIALMARNVANDTDHHRVG